MKYDTKHAVANKALCECVALSNEGASLITEGNYEKAIHSMTAALKLCRWSCKRFTAGFPGGARRNDMKFDVDILIEAESLRDSLAEEQIGGFIYTDPIRLPDLLGECRQAVYVVSLVISFNMGLAHHLQAARCNLPDQRYWLGRALEFYKTSQKLQQRRCSSSKALLSVALLNNMGHVFQTLQERWASISYYNRLLSLIVFMTSYEKIDAKIYQPFLRNALTANQECAVAAQRIWWFAFHETMNHFFNQWSQYSLMHTLKKELQRMEREVLREPMYTRGPPATFRRGNVIRRY